MIETVRVVTNSWNPRQTLTPPTPLCRCCGVRDMRAARVSHIYHVCLGNGLARFPCRQILVPVWSTGGRAGGPHTALQRQRRSARPHNTWAEWSLLVYAVRVSDPLSCPLDQGPLLPQCLAILGPPVGQRLVRDQCVIVMIIMNHW